MTLARNTGMSIAALVAIGGTRVLYGSIVSRTTDPATYGVVGVLIAVTMVASFTLPSGLAAAMTRFVAFDQGRADVAAARGIHARLSRLGLAAAGGLAVIAALAALAFARPMAEVVQVSALTYVYSLYVTTKAALYGFDRVSSYLRLEIATSAVTLAATVVIVLVGTGWYLVPFIVGYALFVVGAQLALRSEVAGETTTPVRSLAITFATYAALASIGTLASAGFLQATQFLAALFGEPAEIGFVAAAVTLLAPLYFLPRALSLALFPFMARTHGAGDAAGLRSQLDLTTRALIALLAPAFVAAIFLAAEILAVFGGPAYTAGEHILRLFLASAYIGVIQVAAVNALSSHSRERLTITVASAVAGCSTGLLFVVAAAPSLGVIGVVIGYLLGTSITAAGPILFAWRAYGMDWTAPLLGGLGLVALAFAVATVTSQLAPGSPTRWLLDGFSALVGVAVVLVALRGHISNVLHAARTRLPLDEGLGPQGITP